MVRVIHFQTQEIFAITYRTSQMSFNPQKILVYRVVMTQAYWMLIHALKMVPHIVQNNCFSPLVVTLVT